ncbi:helix-turn-helix domain-containing protein [Flagellimonas pelagia]|uniref:helix-turn-helix domain-containing protein n=1 Tax=Flagellimonas pelagia TaxID=2306998 RepID=UPI00160513C9|nr:helix-turn-helix transcriptional regulator [Allomuricauda maritima]
MYQDFLGGYFIFPWYLLIVPSFYAFLVYYLQIERERWPFVRISLALFAVAILTRLLAIYLVKIKSFPESLIRNYDLFEDIVALIYSIFLYVKSIKLVFRYQSLYPEILKMDNLNWIKWFLKLGGAVFLFWVFAVIVNTLAVEQNPFYSYYPLRFFSSVLIYWVGYQGFFQYVVLKDRIGLRAHLAKNTIINRRLGDIDLEKRYKGDFESIAQYIRDNERYLDPMLSLNGLADELHMGTSKLSKIINDHAGDNFSDYVNKMRVDVAKKILRNPEYNYYTIVSIGLECGFNSKSAFYASFKKITGMSPLGFRKGKL